MIQWYKKVVLENYANFNGRARRSEYWYFVLMNMLIAITAMILDNITGLAMENIGYGPIYLLYTLAVLIPNLAVSVRRLHDVNKSGWFLLIAFIPLIGAIWLLVLFCSEGTSGENNYGEDPKGINEFEQIGQE
jgi:uncharacterized membrane protein YhaH (DUF805 family)